MRYNAYKGTVWLSSTIPHPPLIIFCIRHGPPFNQCGDRCMDILFTFYLLPLIWQWHAIDNYCWTYNILFVQVSDVALGGLVWFCVFVGGRLTHVAIRISSIYNKPKNETPKSKLSRRFLIRTVTHKKTQEHSSLSTAISSAVYLTMGLWCISRAIWSFWGGWICLRQLSVAIVIFVSIFFFFVVSIYILTGIIEM